MPTRVSGGLQLKQALAGQHTCGVTTLNKPYCWGDNFAGGLGDGTEVSRSVPTPVSGGASIPASAFRSS